MSSLKSPLLLFNVYPHKSDSPSLSISTPAFHNLVTEPTNTITHIPRENKYSVSSQRFSRVRRGRERVERRRRKGWRETRQGEKMVGDGEGINGQKEKGGRQDGWKKNRRKGRRKE
ncbi:hypothetical protein E2C01_027010 [Portunus trituberculatus]|uniref:Uncharacterized protein n=1 Tax=Portunus trituberculatus TaxID=210409 RepID=A0A5B7EKT4_PORTR|nr:hypothetical protein [Portunus trituberculatus]